ncbi:MAG: ribose-5-phosphate isomerase RpiA [Spirochaetes bacterium]|nr:ribose-5-phosphate isomerase RpiA [Brevinematales bacterium]MCL1959871.1 ribose-5-phosphate isomerase RpiA [Spirochaetota bacterium]
MEQDSNRLMKEAAGKASVDAMVKSGMKLGLGTGSTAIHAVRRVGELLKQGVLRDICAFATSFQTEIECEKLEIPFFTLNSRQLSSGLDLTIDGADEVDPKNFIIKGGGGALLIEKLTAYASSLFAVVVDESKLTERLGMGFPVPVEVIPEARVQAARALEKLGAVVMLREALRKAGPVITEHGNLILDIRFDSPVDPVIMETELNKIPGVVENGFFTRNLPVVFIAHSNGTIETRRI